MKNLNCYKPWMFRSPLLCFLWILNPAFSQIPDVKIDTNAVITGLTAPMQLVHAGDGSNRIFIAERAGVIKVFEPGELATPITFLDMNNPTLTVDEEGEGGLLSIVFHPQFEDNGYFYTYYTDTAGDLVLARYTAPDPEENTATTASWLQILKIPHPNATNHNGGELHFGSDGYLYLSTGDGGGADDMNGNAQNPLSLLGKLLRIDVNMLPEETDPYKIPEDNPFNNEVFALGLRNPFRWSFDSETNDIWIGDVGQGKREEINHLSLANLNGANFGWRCFEGDTIPPGVSRDGCGNSEDYAAPVYTYNTGSQRGRSVVGGVVYRGSAYPLMSGFYIGTDYFSGDIHKILPDGSVKTFQTSPVKDIADIGEDESGEIFAVGGSSVYRIYSENSLPVKLVDFRGTAGNEGVTLTWETALEENFREFEVEYSINSRQFVKIGTVVSANGTGVSQYRFLHTVTGTGNLYYRLKMIDNDESFEYSKIIVVKTNDEMSGNFVKPSLIDNGTMHVTLREPYQLLEIVGSNGSVVWKKEISGMAGEITVPMQSTASGIYVIRLAGHDKAVQQKVLILN